MQVYVKTKVVKPRFNGDCEGIMVRATCPLCLHRTWAVERGKDQTRNKRKALKGLEYKMRSHLDKVHSNGKGYVKGKEAIRAYHSEEDNLKKARLALG